MNQIEEEKIYRLIRNNMRSYKYVAQKYNMTVNQVKAIVRKIDLRIDNQAELDDDEYPEELYSDRNEDNEYELDWNGDKIITFGLMGDTQLNSKYAQITHLHNFYDICAKRGIKTVFHTGDIDEGEDMRQGHKYECYNQGVDNHIEEIIKNYPMRDGITTYFITGNHDASITKKVGFNIGRTLQDRREDLKYLGSDRAVVKITPNCTLELRHPWDGTGYSISLKPQKIVDGMAEDDKPDILAIGHYHKSEHAEYKGVNVFQTGAFQGATPFTRGKNIHVSVGGWIVTARVDSEGYLKSICGEWVFYKKDIKDDYKNWR